MGFAMEESMEECLSEETETLEEGKVDESCLQDSGITSPTEAGSVSEEEGGWADFRTLATSLKETAVGVVGFVQRSIAELERDELETHDSLGGRQNESEPLRLPWQIRTGPGAYEEASELKEMVLALSLDEGNFMKPYGGAQLDDDDDDDEEQTFVLDEPRIQLIRNLLEIDENLATTHARLSGRSDIRETVFWRNYFYHCELMRKAYFTSHRPNDDDSQDSLVPVLDGGSNSGDDASFVCVDSTIASPPTSMNSSGFQSIGDLVVVGSPRHGSPGSPRHGSPGRSR